MKRLFNKRTGWDTNDAEQHKRQLVIEPHNGPDGKCAQCRGAGEYTRDRFYPSWNTKKARHFWCLWCHGTGTVKNQDESEAEQYLEDMTE